MVKLMNLNFTTMFMKTILRDFCHKKMHFVFDILFIQYGMDISSSLLEDLITTLDVDQSGEVSYKELGKGLELYQREKRDVKKKGLPMPQGIYLDCDLQKPQDDILYLVDKTILSLDILKNLQRMWNL